MKSSLLRPALMVICLVLAEGRFFKRQSSLNFLETKQDCRYQLTTDCLERKLGKYEDFFKTEEMAEVSLKNRTLLDALAYDLKRAVSCMDTILSLPVCEDVKDDDWDAIRLLAQFMDSPQRLDSLQAAVQSPCIGNDTLSDRAEWEYFTCYMAFIEHMETTLDICAALEGLETCSVVATTTHCGEAAGAFLQSVWDFVENPEVRDSILSIKGLEQARVLFDSCGTKVSAIHAVARRALLMMKK